VKKELGEEFYENLEEIDSISSEEIWERTINFLY
jgi:hypothetical protein